MEIIKIWNENFNKGVSIFQMFLMGIMFVGLFMDNSFVILFAMVTCLIGYFEPNVDRFSIKKTN